MRLSALAALRRDREQEVLRLYCSFVDEETNRSYPFAKGQNGLNGLYAYFFLAHPTPSHPPNVGRLSQSAQYGKERWGGRDLVKRKANVVGKRTVAAV